MKFLKNFKRFITDFVLICLLIIVTSCSSTNSFDESLNENESTGNTGSTTNLTFSYSLTLTIDAEDDDLDMTVSPSKKPTLKMTVAKDGTVDLKAKDIERVVYRACATGSTSSDCDTYSDATSGLDLDLVIDSCGRLVDDLDCGSDDQTAYSGTLDNDGNMHIHDLSIRVRTFLVTDTSDGYSAHVGDEGILPFKRLVIDLTTGTATSGALSDTGDLVADNSVTLVSAGTISTTVDILGGSDFIAVLEGSFNKDPFTLID